VDTSFSEIVRRAARAASAHNTQPWALEEQDDIHVLRLNSERVLGPSDPAGRDTMLSLGCFVETLLICARAEGVGVRFLIAPRAENGGVGRFERVSELYASPFGARDVLGRRVWRGQWLPVHPEPAALVGAEELVRQSGFRLATMPVEDARGLLVSANRWFFRSPAIVGELRRWTRLSPRHSHYGHDGLNDVMLVLSNAERRLLRALIHPWAHRVLRTLGLSELLARSSTAATRGSGLALGVIGTEGAENELEAGRVLTRLWLHLWKEGLYVHPQSHLLDCPETRASLEQRWSVTAQEEVFSWFRVGVPASDPEKRPQHPRLT
jgi:hypothetical protein